jgi:8-oxo-dGTP pyrophosphatase MutT (NUDIX family)
MCAAKNIFDLPAERRELCYENAHQHVYRIGVRGHSGREKELYVNDFGDRVGIVVEGREGILLVQQDRYLIDGTSWEIPGGKREQSESLEEAARRECFEETGVLCANLAPLHTFEPGLDTLRNTTYLFRASQFVDQGLQVGANEVTARRWVPVDRCLDMIRSGHIVDSMSTIALLYLALNMKS